ncbi:MAG: CDP-glycerol glycerophosphotransferase family protein [Nocardioidaceae bacterium]|nr:CDP-glycerol glycerophosphotransferase family protein [Nocardioidaceae bacterium]
MKQWQRPARLAQAAWHRLPPAFRARVRDQRSRLSDDGVPSLSVVVPAYNVSSYVRACLDSALGQSLTSLEVIVVDDGSTDDTSEIVAEYAARDPRVTLLRQENAGQGPARNLGVQQARGTYLTFLDADDVVPAGAYRAMVVALRRSGSDFAIGSVRRTTNGKTTNPGWVQLVHDRDRIGITIDDFPDVLQDVIACNRVIRRQFWIDQIGGFGPGAYEDHVPMVAAFVRATSFDVLKRVTYHWRVREDKSSTSQQKHELQNLLDRIAVKREAHAILEKEASPAIQAAWLSRVLDTDLSLYITYALQSGETYRARLQQALAHYVDAAGTDDDRVWRAVRVHQKIRTHLAAHGAWDDLETVAEMLRAYGNIPPTSVTDGVVAVDASLVEGLGLETPVPAHLLRLADSEVSLQATIDRLVWADDDVLELRGWAHVRGVDTERYPVEVALALVDGATGARTPLDVTMAPAPAAATHAREINVSYTGGGFVARVDVAAWARTAGDPTHDLEVHVASAGIQRDGHVLDFTAGSSAASPEARWVGGRLVVPAFDSGRGLGLTLVTDALTTTALAASGRRVTGTFTWAGPGRPQAVRASRRGTGERVEVGPRGAGAQAFDFALDLPAATGDEQGTWDVRVVLPDGSLEPVRWPGSESRHAVGSAGAGHGWWRRTPDARAVALVDRPRLEVTQTVADDDALRVRVVWDGLDEQVVRTTSITNDRLSVAPEAVEDVGDHELTLRFPTTVSLFDLEPAAVPCGHYQLVATAPDGSTVAADGTPELVAAMPVERTGSWLTSRFSYARVGETRLTIHPPLDLTERSRPRQRELKTWFRETVQEPEDAVYLQCYRGEVAADSQLALHHHLRETRPDLTLYWGVADRSTIVPEGGVPVLMFSREWYETIGRARWLCTNVDFDPFFLTRPHQRYVQTFHGYPFKSMGRTFWEGRMFTPGRIDRETARRNAEWDAIVVPSDDTAQMYRDEYDYTGEILVTGYPRCDALVQPDDAAAQVRERVLRRLGIDPAKTVVMYAPTYRDHLTTRVFAAKRFDELDLDVLTRALGPDHVLLLRGHNNNQREHVRELGRAQVVDATDYPDINDLTIAADAAVLDYSSLRFDWALTGKPMVFFVPDLDTYFKGRPPLFPYDGTTPGPRTTTTEQTAEALADLPALRARYGEEVAAFNRRFNALHDGKATGRVARALLGDEPA